MKEEDKYFFSIIVPIYNVEDYLPECLKSIENQIFKNYELILVDDGSNDKSGLIADQFANKKENVKVVHKQNGGLASARNTGLKIASGAYIIYVDSDDYIYPSLLEKNHEFIFKYNPDLIIFNYHEKILDNGNIAIQEPEVRFPYKKAFYTKQNLVKEIYPTVFEMRNVLTCWRICYKSAFLKQHYCKNENISKGEDYAFTYECLYYANTVYISDEILYVYNKTRQTSIAAIEKNNIQNMSLLGNYMMECFGLKEIYIQEQLSKYFIGEISNFLHFYSREKNNYAASKYELKFFKYLVVSNQ